MLFKGMDGMFFRSLEDCGYGECEAEDGELVVSDCGLGESLGAHLGLPDDFDLYDCYSYYFLGDVKNDFFMCHALFTEFFNKSEVCFCIEVNRTFCFFIPDNPVRILGQVVYNGNGRYIDKSIEKSLRYIAVNYGYRLGTVYSNSEFKFARFKSLNSLFGDLDYKDAHYLLSTDLKRKNKITSLDLALCMSTASVKKDELYFKWIAKDFSVCKALTTGTMGLIIDCEGKQSGRLSDGFRSIGGLVWRKSGNYLSCLETFECDDKIVDGVLTALLSSWKIFGVCHVIVFGASDITMFKAGVENTGNSKFISTVNRVFKFVDCRSFLHKMLGKDKSLAESANLLNVKVITPLHSPENDARTLFNILAMLLLKESEFVVK